MRGVTVPPNIYIYSGWKSPLFTTVEKRNKYRETCLVIVTQPASVFLYQNLLPKVDNNWQDSNCMAKARSNLLEKIFLSLASSSALEDTTHTQHFYVYSFGHAKLIFDVPFQVT